MSSQKKDQAPEAIATRQQIVLSGTKPTGEHLHLGNYFGALRQFVDLQEEHDTALYFVADYHSMTSIRDGEERRRNTESVVLDYLAAGLDPSRAILFRQSDLPEVTELTWMLSSITTMGMLERAHAYKAATDKGEEIDHGTFTYPVLMAADILLYGSHLVPVGKDQKQHIEMARDMAGRFNRYYDCEALVLPEPYILEDTATVPGTDGRKMSKSYNNIIPLFAPEKKFRKLIMKIKTNSLEPGEPKGTEGSTLFEIYRAFATEDETKAVEKLYADGIAWGEMKQMLFEYINDHIKPAREKYESLIADPSIVEKELQRGAEKAREISKPYLAEIRHAIGIRRLG